jgi:hypothetical protein
MTPKLCFEKLDAAIHANPELVSDDTTSQIMDIAW